MNPPGAKNEAPDALRPQRSWQTPLLRLAATCPRCGSRPALRITECLVAAMRDQTPDAQVSTYQCQRRGCGTIYPIPAHAYQAAC